MTRFLFTLLFCLALVVPAYAGQSVNIIDANDEMATVTEGKLDVNASLPSGVTADTAVVTNTAKILAPSQTIYAVTLSTDRDNAHKIYLGGSALTVQSGFELVSGATVRIETDNLTDIYIIADTTASAFITPNTVHWIAEIR